MTDPRANLITDGRQVSRAETANPEGAGNPGAEAQGRAGCPAQARPARQEALGRAKHAVALCTAHAPAPHGPQQLLHTERLLALRGLVQEVVEHRRLGVAAVVPPHVLVDVALEPFL